MASINDFAFLNNTAYRQIYKTIEKAMQYYSANPNIACDRFRNSLECILDHIDVTLKIEKDDCDLYNRIEVLRQLPEDLINHSIIDEMHTLRSVSNLYHHYYDEDRDPSKDRVTCYVALLKVCKWFVEFPIKYKSYLESEEQKRRKRKETRKTIGKIALVSIAIVGAIFGITKLNNK